MPMSDKHVLTILACLLAGCGSSEVLFVEWPELPQDVKSVILIEAREEGPVSATRLVEAEMPDVLRIGTSRLSSVSVLAYYDSFETLELIEEEGQLVPASSGSCATKPLPSADVVLTLAWAQGERSFSEAPAPLPEIAELQFERPCPCVRIEEQRVVDLGLSGDVEALRRVGDHWLVAAAHADYELSDDLELLATSTMTAARGKTISAFIAENGRIFRGRDDGVIDIIDGDSLYLSETVGRRIEDLDGSPDGSEVFAINNHGAVFMFKDDTWSTVFDTPSNQGGSQNSILFWRGPGQIAFGQQDADGLIELDVSSGELILDDVMFEPLRGIGFIEGLGLLISTRLNHVYRREAPGESWIRLQGDSALQPRDFLHFHEGFLQLGLASVSQFDRRSEFCAPASLSRQTEIKTARVDGNRILAAGRREGSQSELSAIHVLEDFGPRE